MLNSKKKSLEIIKQFHNHLDLMKGIKKVNKLKQLGKEN